jgi:pyruvate/2-oxoglutarate dehydrogenase complex dihydrolipoamide dehydrogenase (E3) component
MPSKNELWSARGGHLVRDAARFGTLADDVRTDMREVRQRKQDMIDREIAFHLRAYEESGAELIMGSGRFAGPKTIDVSLNDGGTRSLTGNEIVLNVGSHAAIPDVPGLKQAHALTHIEALELDDLPPHLIVLGGGYTGIEMAQAYRRFGSRVTIIEPGLHHGARRCRCGSRNGWSSDRRRYRYPGECQACESSWPIRRRRGRLGPDGKRRT